MDHDGHRAHSTLDLDRHARMGHPEVVYGEGKSAAHICDALTAIHGHSGFAFATRVDGEKAAFLQSSLTPAPEYNPVARVLHLGAPPAPRGLIGVVSAGTSDEFVAAEVAIVARLLGNEVLKIVDVGVAGLHRVLGRTDELRACSVIVVVAGMDGALPSVVGGLVGLPIVAVPTSVGYGTGLGGIAALLAMLNSCAPGIAVVNIDNGFGAAYAASRINHTVHPNVPR
ncbi:1-(5-phosphoribosyl)-5-amino-4-imidazole-carboxylate carboxylase [Deltaproteobacteria bacterium]|nr:1-(5-phosphoribosyl)-5-amino-4-imidazole-carboxylate carboxylase [Deltaproteobacteria bacterium]